MIYRAEGDPRKKKFIEDSRLKELKRRADEQAGKSSRSAL